MISWPVILKDLYLCRRILLCNFLLAILAALTLYLGAAIDPNYFDLPFLQLAFKGLHLLPVIASALLCFLIVLNDPPLFTSPRWMVRPIPRAKLALTKVALIIVSTVLLPIVTVVIASLAMGFGARHISSLAIEQFLFGALYALYFLNAALFVLLIQCAFRCHSWRMLLAFLPLLGGAIFISIFLFIPGEWGLVRPQSGSTAFDMMLVRAALTTLLLATVTNFLYFFDLRIYPDFRSNFSIPPLGILILVVPIALWLSVTQLHFCSLDISSLNQQREGEKIKLELPGGELNQISIAPLDNSLAVSRVEQRTGVRYIVSAVEAVSGLPKGTVLGCTKRSEAKFSSNTENTTVPSEPLPSDCEALPWNSSERLNSFYFESLPERIVNVVDVTTAPRNIFSLTPENFDIVRGKSGTYQANSLYELYRFKVSHELKLQQGESLTQNETLVTIQEFNIRATDIQISVVERSLNIFNPTLAAERASKNVAAEAGLEPIYLLVNKERDEAYMLRAQTPFSGSDSKVGDNSLSAGFLQDFAALKYLTLTIPLSPSNSAPSLSWLHEAKLVRLRPDQRSSLTIPIRYEHFVMPEYHK